MPSVSSSIVETFINDGVVVIPNVLDEVEVANYRQQLAASLAVKGVDVNHLQETSRSLQNYSSTGGAGGILDIFYEDWKLQLNEHPRIVDSICDLLDATYASNHELFRHPFGSFDAYAPYMYIDRMCYRVPDAISDAFKVKKKSLQRSLTPHLDCCPHDMYSKLSKWRPIQAFIALTDTLHANEGGFEACPQHHRHFDSWVQHRVPSQQHGKSIPPPCVGNFTPIRPLEDSDVMTRMQHVPCRAGDLVCWDYRIPHANSLHNQAATPREVVYIGVLPGIPLNEAYARDQLTKYRAGTVPNDQWHSHTNKQHCNFEFSVLGRKMMSIDAYK